jgi:hypothetical protein
MRVKTGNRYIYRPSFIDIVNPPMGPLTDGQTVRVTRLHGCPPANTMGHCHITDTAGRFVGLVSTNSLYPISGA